MKNVALFVLIVVGYFMAVQTSDEPKDCQVVNNYKSSENWLDMVSACDYEVKKQIQAEVDASIEYLSMGAYFSRDVVNRPGFAKMFFEAASEERHHAMKLIEYLLMRKEIDANSLKSLISLKSPKKTDWEDGVEALNESLELEASVTKKIRNVIVVCESGTNSTDTTSSFNDYHLVDYLTGEFLEEQYKGQRDLAGKLTTLSKMKKANGVLGEYLFDKKLLKGEIF